MWARHPVRWHLQRDASGRQCVESAGHRGAEVSCGGCRQSGPDTDRLLSHLESIGWRPIAETALLGIREAVTKSQEQYDKAATAVALGLPDAIAQRHTANAGRFSKQATDLLSQLTAQLHDRAASSDW